MIHICTHCGSLLVCAPQQADRVMPCPTCRHPFRLPRQTPEESLALARDYLNASRAAEPGDARHLP